MASSPAASPTPYTLKTILQFKPFRTMWMGQFVSIFGDFLALFAVINYITFRLHGNALQVTDMMIYYMLPMAFITPVAGVFVDHWNVKRLMIASDLIRAGLIIGLVFAHSATQISAILFAISIVSSFFMPAQSVTVRTIVPMQGLLAADRKSTRLNSSHLVISYAVFCLKKKNKNKSIFRFITKKNKKQIKH